MSNTVIVSGASGFIGSALCRALEKEGCRVMRLVRRETKSADEIFWDPESGKTDAAKLEGVPAVIHLAGENIAEGRWSEAKKRRIRESRVKGTRLVAETLAALRTPPRTLVCASAIGWYGDRGDTVLAEDAPPAADFLGSACRDWEAACDSAKGKGIRVVNARIGIVLSPEGGALKRMLLPFKMGAGGVLGSGRQWMSWIALDDAVAVFLHALKTESLHGPVNAAAPNPVTNYDFTKTLGRVLRRPTVMPMPAFAARLAFGEMADALLLSSTRVVPKKLRESGFTFKYPELEGALRSLLKK